MHIRRRDNAKRCNTTIPAVLEYLACSIAHIPNATTDLILFTDDYRQREYRLPLLEVSVQIVERTFTMSSCKQGHTHAHDRQFELIFRESFGACIMAIRYSRDTWTITSAVSLGVNRDLKTESSATPLTV